MSLGQAPWCLLGACAGTQGFPEAKEVSLVAEKGFLYRAGAETLMLVKGTSRKILSPGRNTEIRGAYPENMKFDV